MPIALPPAVVSVQAPAVPGRSVEIAAFAPEITCAGSPVGTEGLVLPRPVVVPVFGPRPQGFAPASYRLDFTIDEQGRARTIRRVGIPPYPGGYVDTSDLAPSLAASRFAAGMPASRCSVTYRVTSMPVASAPLPLLYELASMPQASDAPELWSRVRPVWSDCARGPGQYRSLNLPAFEKLPQRPGTSAWLFLAYDVDRQGRRAASASSARRAMPRSTAQASARSRRTATHPGPATAAAPTISTGTTARPATRPTIRPARPPTTASRPDAASIRKRSPDC